MKITRKVRRSYDPTEADTYIIKIWHEVEANGEETYGPEAAEEIFEVVATSPQEAKEIAKRQWSGPIDRIEIVDINPENSDDYIPFDSCDDIKGSDIRCSRKIGFTEKVHKLVKYLNEEGVDEGTMVSFFLDNLYSEDCYNMLKKLAEECDIDLEDFYTYVLKEYDL